MTNLFTMHPFFCSSTPRCNFFRLFPNCEQLVLGLGSYHLTLGLPASKMILLTSLSLVERSLTRTCPVHTLTWSKGMNQFDKPHLFSRTEQQSLWVIAGKIELPLSFTTSLPGVNDDRDRKSHSAYPCVCTIHSNIPQWQNLLTGLQV